MKTLSCQDVPSPIGASQPWDLAAPIPRGASLHSGRGLGGDLDYLSVLNMFVSFRAGRPCDSGRCRVAT
eukprot:14579299-Alexandrium_andersonii.AAC.1